MIEPANPLLNAWSGPLGAPPFAQVQPAHFLPALHDAISLHDAELASIRENASPPDFDNTIAALERSGATLARIRRMFWTLSSAQATNAIRGIEADVSALLNDHGTAISHDSALFGRIAAVHASRHESDLDGAQLRLVETSYAGFVRGGAALDGDAKARVAEIDARLAQLSIQFSQNIMAATSDWALVLTQEDLDGLSDAMRSGAAARAEAAGKPGEYHFSLGRGDYEAFLTFSSRRDLRERLWRAFTGRCNGGAHDNWPIIAEILGLRGERARLLGYANYADYVLDDSMARTPDAARDLLDQLWSPALDRAKEEAAELQALIDADGDTFALAAWDWRFYAERVRRDRYAMDGGTIRAYLRLDEVRKAAFDTASRLYDLRFNRREDIAGYDPDVWAWDVTDGAGAAVGLLFTDYLARPEKHGGAWMGSLRVQEKLDGDVRPIVYLVANFPPAPPPDLGSTRLSVDEARTLFHEFGHALHGLLSDVVYPSQSGTSVARDFVEFPSKFMENWMVSREVLSGMGVPDPLIDALRKAEEYGQGFAAVELVSCALLDLAMHQAPEAAADPKAFMRAELARLGMPDTIGLRHQLPYFSHIFDGGYASGYYSYLWSEVLDADAFEAFTQAGDIFDPTLAARFRREVLSQGDQRDPMVSYRQFRGRAPDTSALLRARYLI